MNRNKTAQAVQQMSIAVSLLIIIFGFQNCMKNETKTKQNNSSQGNPPAAPADDDPKPDPDTDPVKKDAIAELKSALEKNMVDDCAINEDYNACIFWKNPVAQVGAPLAAPITRTSDLSGIQIHAVKLEGYDDSGLLKNGSFFVRALNPNGRLVSLSTESGQFKFGYNNDPIHRVGQVMAFYWLTVQEKYMKEVTGDFFASNKGISVVSYVPNLENAYWDADLQEVVLGSSAAGNEFALGAEVYAHEMGHANINYATDYAINETVGSFESAVCSGGQGVCCRTVNGCSWAINEGQADYHAGILFPSNVNFLESFVNNPDGLNECGLSRNIDASKDLTADQAYNACNAQFRGEVHVTGRIYASVWWEVRKAAEAQEPGKGADEVDVLFTNHLVALDASDTFVTAMDKVLAVDQALYQGKYSEMFTDEFARRGIQ